MIKTFWVVFLIVTQAFASVWFTNKSWTAEMEDRYSSWVSTQWHNDMFTNEESPLHGLETDCADASYAMRAYFAFQNGLPVSFRRHNGERITQELTQFDRYKDSNVRFREFLKYLFDETDTHTLSLDTYAVSISRETFRAGIVYVSPGIHSYQITGLDRYGLPETLSSTVPRQKRLLFSHHGFPFYLPGESRNYSDGFRAFRTTGRELNSSEQFDVTAAINGDFIQYQNIMIQKLQLSPEPFDRRISRIKDNLCFFARERAVLVADAFVKKVSNKNMCFGPIQFDDYSTYIRDKKLKNYFLEFKKMTGEKEWQALAIQEKNKLLSSFLTEVPDNDCVVETSLPMKETLRLSEIYRAIESGTLVSDPNASMAQRWGLDTYKPMCTLY